jgi:hypothetical protein
LGTEKQQKVSTEGSGNHGFAESPDFGKHRQKSSVVSTEPVHSLQSLKSHQSKLKIVQCESKAADVSTESEKDDKQVNQIEANTYDKDDYLDTIRESENVDAESEHNRIDIID